MPSFERQIAVKCRIEDILSGTFLKGEGLEPSFVQTVYGNIARASIVGVLINAQGEEGMLDDGSGSIPMRSFNRPGVFQNAKPGDAVLCIGKVREFQGARYLLLEILKKLQDPVWIRVRQAELKRRTPLPPKPDVKPRIEELPKQPSKTKQALLDRIKEMDGGEGVMTGSVVRSAEEEGLLQELILEGDVFELKPGVVKSLE